MSEHNLLKRKAPREAGLCQHDGELDSALGDADRATAFFALDAELHRAINQGEQGVIAAEADAGARMKLGAALANDDVAGIHGLSAVNLHPEVFGVRIAAVTGTAASFFMCHDCLP